MVLGREWIHGIVVFPSSMHQKVMIRREDGLVEDVEADRSYFLAEVNNITRKTFEKSLAKIAPCSFAEDRDDDQIGKSCKARSNPWLHVGKRGP